MVFDTGFPRAIVALAALAGVAAAFPAVSLADKGAGAADAAGKADGAQARGQTSEELRAEIRKIDQRITEISREVREETASGTRKLREDSRTEFERDLEILKADLATLRAKTESAGTRITRNVGETLSTLGQKLGDLGATLRKDADASAAQGGSAQPQQARPQSAQPQPVK